MPAIIASIAITTILALIISNASSGSHTTSNARNISNNKYCLKEWQYYQTPIAMPAMLAIIQAVPAILAARTIIAILAITIVMVAMIAILLAMLAMAAHTDSNC